MKNLLLHQIYYDESSKRLIDPVFIPLDNCNGPPEWFEFYPILRYLEANVLQDNYWYGFLSPKFSQKTGIEGSQILNLLKKFGEKADVALFSPSWDQLAYFKNPFEQGEFRHPGLLEIAQDFLNTNLIKCNLKSLVTYSSTAVFSNFVVAKGSYWKEWLRLGVIFYEYAERVNLGETIYLDAANKRGPMKTFIQERLPSIILSLNKYKVLSPDFGQSAPIFDGLFDNNPRVRKMLQACDLMKEKYCITNDESYLNMYRKIRNEIKLKRPHPRALEFD